MKTVQEAKDLFEDFPEPYQNALLGMVLPTRLGGRQ